VTGKDPQSQLDSALAACGRLHEENARLRRLLSEHGIDSQEAAGLTLVYLNGQVVKPSDD